MALLAEGALANVYASLDRYLAEQFIETALLVVRLHGVRRFVPPVDAPWLEAHYAFLGLQGHYRRQIRGLSGGEDVFGIHRDGYLQLNLFQRARIFTQRYTTAAGRDVVVNAFPEAGMIGIFDYVNQIPDTTPVRIGVLQWNGITEACVDDGYQSGVTQHMLQVQTRYLEQYTRPSL